MHFDVLAAAPFHVVSAEHALGLHAELGQHFSRSRVAGQVVRMDPRQPEAQYNLGYLTLERGHAEESIPLFQGALEADPKFSDAYFNLAMAFEQAGHADKAQPYWRSYVELEPHGTWSEIARRHL